MDVPAGASGYERIGAPARPRDRAPAETADGRWTTHGDSILGGLTTADLVTTEGDLDRRGGLVLLVAGAPLRLRGRARRRREHHLTALVTASTSDRRRRARRAGRRPRARRAGRAPSASDAAAARDVSTVDAADRAAGAVVTVLALGREAAGESGHYGAVDAADGAMPGAAVAQNADRGIRRRGLPERPEVLLA